MGAVKVVFRNVYIHQTTEMKLAIGAQGRCEAVLRFLQNDGCCVDDRRRRGRNERQRVKVRNFETFSRTDNPPADLLISILKFGPVNRAIRQTLEYDYSQDYDKAIKAANGRTDETSLRRLQPKRRHQQREHEQDRGRP